MLNRFTIVPRFDALEMFSCRFYFVLVPSEWAGAIGC